MTSDIINYILGVCIGIIGFFLKALYTDIKSMQTKIQEHSTSIEVLKSGHNDILNSLSEIKSDLKDLIKEVHNKK